MGPGLPFLLSKFEYPPSAPTALGPFLTKLADKNYSIDQRHHAAMAIRLLLWQDLQDQAFIFTFQTWTWRTLNQLLKPKVQIRPQA